MHLPVGSQWLACGASIAGAASVTDDEIEGIYAKKRQATHTGLWTVINEHRLSENKQLDQTKLANIFVRVWNSFCMKMMSLCENFDADAASVNPEQAHSSASKCVRLAKDVWRSCMVVKREVVHALEYAGASLEEAAVEAACLSGGFYSVQYPF